MKRCFRLAALFAVCGVLLGAWGCKRKKAPVKRKVKPPKRVVIHTNIPAGSKVYREEVVLQPGTFMMGSPSDEEGRLKVEGPRHKVKLLRVFVMWRHETSQADFRRIMGYNPSRLRACGGLCPVDHVTWHEAAAFCNKLSEKRNLTTCFKCTGKGKHSICQAAPEFKGKNYYRCPGYRLPTEAEWEYAARAGASGRWHKPVGKKESKLQTVLDRIAWHGLNSFVKFKGALPCPKSPMDPGAKDSKEKSTSRCGPKPVGQKQPNRFGLFDMLGNNSEWVYDHYGRYTRSNKVEPVGPGKGHRVFRGCNWFQMTRECRIARRFWVSPGVRSHTLGFRPVRTLGMRRKR